MPYTLGIYVSGLIFQPLGIHTLKRWSQLLGNRAEMRTVVLYETLRGFLDMNTPSVSDWLSFSNINTILLAFFLTNTPSFPFHSCHLSKIRKPSLISCSPCCWPLLFFCSLGLLREHPRQPEAEHQARQFRRRWDLSGEAKRAELPTTFDERAAYGREASNSAV